MVAEPPRNPPPSRAKRVVRVVLAFIVAPIVLGVIVLFVLATTPWGNERVRRILVSQGNRRITGELIVDRLRGNLFTGATLTNVQVMDSLKSNLQKYKAAL